MGRSKYPGETVCCPTNYKAANGTCTCQNVTQTSPDYTVSCADTTPPGRRRNLRVNLPYNKEKRDTLSPREAVNLLQGKGTFEYRGRMIRDSTFEHLQKRSWDTLISRGTNALFQRSLPVLGKAIRMMFRDEHVTFPLSENFQIRAGDMPHIIDMFLEDPEFEHLDFRSVRFPRESLMAMKNMFPFRNSTFH